MKGKWEGRDYHNWFKLAFANQRACCSKAKKKKNQNNTHPQTLQTNPQKITKSTEYQEKIIFAYLNRSTQKIESQSHDVSLKIHF